MKLTLRLSSGKSLSAEVNDSDGAGAYAWFERLIAPASALDAGQATEVELDWAVLRLEADENEVQVLEPDYSVTDPDRFVTGVARTGRVFSTQVQLMQMLQLPAESVLAQQYVRIAESALNGVSAFGHRFPETESLFTGWQISSAASAADDTFGQFSVRELAHRHLAWIVGLCLPSGWSFRFAGNSLIDCVAPTGQTHAVMLSIDV